MSQKEKKHEKLLEFINTNHNDGRYLYKNSLNEYESTGKKNEHR